MRLPRTLFLHLAREILLYSILGFVVITTVLVSQNLLRRLDDLVMVGFEGRDFLIVLRSLIPMLTTYSVPVAFVFGTLLAVRRASSESEILAMRACGLGLRHILAPAMALAVFASLISAYLMLYAEHSARRDLRDLFAGVAARGALLEPGRFRGIGSRVIFVQSRDRHNRLEGVMISDWSQLKRPYLVFAERGQFQYDENLERILLRLENGDLHFTPHGRSNRYQRISFRSFDYGFEVGSLLSEITPGLRPKDMSSEELREVLARAESGESLEGLADRNPVKYALHLHRRYALPFAPILFAAVAVPLGLRPSRGARAWGALVCLVLVFTYYALLSTFELVAREGWLSAPVALWAPNLIFAVAAWLLLRRARRGFET